MIRAIVLDLDDTLYSEREYAFSGFDAVAREFSDVLGNQEQSARRMRELFDSPHRRRVFNAMLAACGRAENAELVQRMILCFREHRPAIRLYEDAAEALTRLRPRYKLGLITDGPPVQQWAKIDALGLRSRFDQIIVTSECQPEAADDRHPSSTAPQSYGKPHTLAFQQMSRRLGVSLCECIYVADNPAKDFIAPNRLGWRTVQIRRPGGVYHAADTADGGAPNDVLGDLNGLDAVLQR